MRTQHTSRPAPGVRGWGLPAFVFAPAAWILAAGMALGHNLDQRMTYMVFDPATLEMLGDRTNLWPLIGAGDEIALVIKTTPGPGTPTGAGGYMTLYVPPGTQVAGAEYVVPDGTGKFVAVPMKGQAIDPIGSGPIGPASTPELIGLVLGTNIVGQLEATVDATGVHRGTLAGLYGDTGIFYSRSPKTVWQSWAASGGYDRNVATPDNTLVNNRGETIFPVTQWDAEQLIAYGMKSPASPVVDPNGRGSAPWGLANVVPGPESGYAWQFNRDIWLNTNAYPAASNRMKAAVSQVGPWSRIRYPGSQVSKDQAGLRSVALGFAGIDASYLGHPLASTNPLPATLSWADTTSPKAVRFSYGALEINRPEYARVHLKILANPGETNSPFDPNGCFLIFADAFGGDAGGENGGKDHEWRYYDPTYVSLNPCAVIQKIASKNVLAPNEVFFFTVTAVNTSTNDLTNVTISDTLPSGLTFVSSIPPQSGGPNPLTWTFPRMPRGAVSNYIIYVRATGSGLQENNVTLYSDQVIVSARETVIIGAQALLYANKTGPTSCVFPGEVITYTLTVTNTGSAANSTPLIVTDYLPTGFLYQSLGPVYLNGGPIAPAYFSVNAANPAQPVFAVSQGIQPGKALVINLQVLVGAGVPSGVYGNQFSYSWEGRTLASGSFPVEICGGRIGDTVYRDWNGNGALDAGEEGLPGVTMLLYRDANSNLVVDAGDVLLTNAVTDAAGLYLFSGLSAGRFVVQVAAGVPAGYTLTGDPVGALDGQAGVNLGVNEQRLNIDFGYRPGGTGSIGDQVFQDVSRDGVYNPGTDLVITGVTLRLYEDMNGNGALDGGDLLLAVTNSNASGLYTFSGLATGLRYLVDVDETSPALFTHFGIYRFVGTTPDPHVVTNLVGAYTNADFGFFRDLPASIGDEVFLDNNKDNVFSPGVDTPLPGVTLNLYRDLNSNNLADAGEYYLSTESSAAGLYVFSGLAPGRYVVEVDTADPQIPSGWFPSFLRYARLLAAGSVITNADFPFVPLIDKTVDRASANPGDTLTYEVRTYYPGPSLLVNAEVTDPVPTGSTYIAGSANAGGTNNNGVVTWALGSNAADVPGGTVGTGSALYPAPPYTVVADADTYISAKAGDENKNYGVVTPLKTRPAGAEIKHAFVHFGLAGVPSNAIVQSAYLSMKSSTDRKGLHFAEIRRMLTPWREGTGVGTASGNGATWNRRDGTNAWAAGSFSTNDYAATVYGTLKANNKAQSVDVTDLVKAWRASTNNGFVMRAIGSDTTDANWPARSDGTPANRPTLTVRYLLTTNVAVGATVTNEAAADSHIELANPTKNNGAANTIKTEPLPGDGQAKYGLLKFDLGNIPPGSVISNATLLLTVQDNQTAMTDTLYRLLTPWSENAVTWNTRNGFNAWAAGAFSTSDYAAAALGQFVPNQPDETVLTQNLTAVVNDWVNNGVANNGLVLVSRGTQTSDADYYSRHNAATNYRPRLIVSWRQNLGGGVASEVRLRATPYLLSGTGRVEIAMNVTAQGAVNNVIPPTNLTVNGSGFTATKASGPTPSGAVNLASNVTAVFRYVYNVSAGAEPELLSFSGRPTSTNLPFAAGVSEGILLTPVLTYRVTVNNPNPFPAVTNTATLSDDSTIEISDTVVTSLGGTIGDFVWTDGDGDGVQDLGEGGIAGVTLRLYGASGTNLLSTTATDPSGHYYFTGLAAGSYRVTYDLPTAPAGYEPTTPVALTVNLATGEQYLAADFGLQPPVGRGTLGDTVWLDRNGNGVQDAGEAGISNVTLQLYLDVNTNRVLDAADVWLRNTVTSTNGVYGFSNLNLRAYHVAVVTSSLPAGVVSTTGGDLQSTSLTFAAQAILTLDFGYNHSAALGDFVWYDMDGDGAQDPGEPGFSNAVLLLSYDANFNGYIDGGDYNVGFQQTDGNGNYLFTNLPGGTYFVICDSQTLSTPTVPASWFSWIPTWPTNLFGGSGGEIYTVYLPPGVVDRTADFGFTQGAILGDDVFHDANGNGFRDGGEPGLPNVKVTVTGVDYNGTPVNRFTNTDLAGKYQFFVRAGSYTVAYDTADADIPAALTRLTTPTSYARVVVSGDIADDLDFGRDHAGVIGDTVFTDADGNGSQGFDESGLPGILVLLYGASGTNLLNSQITDFGGHYYFRGLPDGTYTVQVVTNTLPPGYDRTPTADPTPPADSRGTAVIVGGGQVLTMDFGYRPFYPTYHVSGRVWNDNGVGTASNGVLDAGEPGITGVVVFAYADTNGNGVVDMIFAVVTGSNGYYEVAGLPNGSTVTVIVVTNTLPSTGFIQTGDPDGVLDSRTVVAILGTNVTDRNFGYLEVPGSISGTVVDGDGDGVAGGPNDRPLSNVTVTLRYAGADGILHTPDDTFRVTVTDSNGFYRFTGLPPGLYDVEETNPPGYVSLADADGGDPDVIRVDLHGGQTVTGRDFEDGIFAVLGDFVWDDRNADGLQQVGETGVAGVVVYLLDSNGVRVATNVTDAAGLYVFVQLRDPVYELEFDLSTLPPDYTVSPQNVGTNDQVDSDGDPVTGRTGATTLSPGELDRTWDLGVYRTSKVGDFVWNDYDRDGIQDAGESGVLGATVQLLNAASNVVTGTVSDAQGWYRFDRVRAGTYLVRFLPPSTDYVYTATRAGTNDNLDSDADYFSGTTLPLALPPGTVRTNVDCGLYSSVITYLLVERAGAEMRGGAPYVTWETAGEAGAAAFAVRRETADGRWVPVGDDLLPAVGATAVGGSYRLRDLAVSPGGTYRYRIVEIDAQGRRTEHGPFAVTVPDGDTGPALADAFTFAERPAAARAAAPAPAARHAASLAAGTPVEAVKVLVVTDALYRVTAAQLASAFGLDPAEVDARLQSDGFRLRNRGRDVAALGEPAGLAFFGAGLETRYASGNVYWITPEAGVAPARVPVSPAADAPGQTMIVTTRVERSLVLRPDLFFDAGDDPWLWRGLYSGSTLQRTFAHAFALAAPVSNRTLRLRLKGSLATATNQVSVAFNGRSLGLRPVRGLEHADWTFDVGAAPVLAVSTVTVTSLTGPEVFVDDFELAYVRGLVAAGGELFFTAEAGEARTATGFASAGPEVFDVTSDTAWRILQGAAAGGGAPDHHVSLIAPAAGRYLAVAGGLRRAPAAIVPDHPSDLRSPTNGADYLVIAPDALAGAADAFVAWRAAHGLLARRVALEDIYDEFNHGLPDARAVHAFLGYAYRLWARAPQYVLLLGEGSLDYRNNLGYGDCLVPPLLGAGAQGQFASDVLHGDLNGDGVPEIAVGRIPAQAADEALAALAKVQAYETGGAWRQQALAIADQAEPSCAFAADSDALVSRLAGFDARRAYVQTSTVEAVHAAVLNALNQGCGVVTYVGHASMPRLGKSGPLLDIGDARTNLANASRPPLVAALTCLAGHFATPGQDSLGEALVAGSNGAAAVWSPVTMVYHDDNRALGDALVSNLFVRGTARLGDALRATLAAGADQGRAEACRAYSLLGDPALAVGDLNAGPGGDPAPGGLPAYDEWLAWAVAPAVADLGLGLAPADDLDGDGQRNVEELYAGTDPASAASALRILQAGLSDGAVVLRWTGSARRVYSLERAADGGPFEIMAPTLDGTAPWSEYIDSIPGGGVIVYRVLVK